MAANDDHEASEHLDNMASEILHLDKEVTELIGEWLRFSKA